MVIVKNKFTKTIFDDNVPEGPKYNKESDKRAEDSYTATEWSVSVLLGPLTIPFMAISRGDIVIFMFGTSTGLKIQSTSTRTLAFMGIYMKHFGVLNRASLIRGLPYDKPCGWHIIEKKVEETTPS